MAAVSDETCPRCRQAFHCGINDTQPCACTSLTLDAATLARLRRMFSGCLCLRCLQALSQSIDKHSEGGP